MENIHGVIQPQAQQAHRQHPGIHFGIIEQRAAVEIDIVAQPFLGGSQFNNIKTATAVPIDWRKAVRIAGRLAGR